MPVFDFTLNGNQPAVFELSDDGEPWGVYVDGKEVEMPLVEMHKILVANDAKFLKCMNDYWRYKNENHT